MEKIFGLPVDTLLVWLTSVLVIGLLLLAVVAVRNRVLFWIGVRNIARRPAQTTLIVLGLMLATLLVSAALVTGDTMKYSIQKNAIESLGETDLVVQPKSQETISINGSAGEAGGAYADGYLQPADYKKIARVLKQGKDTDGFSPVLSKTVPAGSPKGRRNLPTLELLGLPDNRGGEFEPMKDGAGRRLPISSLQTDQAYISNKAAKKLAVKKSGQIELFTKEGPQTIEIRGVFEEGGKPSGGSVIVMKLAAAQELFKAGNGINGVLISGEGDNLAGVERTKAISKSLKPVLKDHPYEVETVKQDALDSAAEAATGFTSIFLVFGQFSMMAGIMLIFLIFVMLAAERKTELGVMRALGAQKRDLLKIFLFEGTMYALLSAVVGALLGIAVGWAMVRVMGEAFGGMDAFSLSFAFKPESIIIAYAIGVVATFVIVAFSAWRVGHVNIVRAIRDLPEPTKGGRSWKWLISLLILMAASVAITISGYQSEQQGVFMLGLSLAIIALPLIARWVGLPDRAAYSIAGISLVGIWLMPEDIFTSILPGYENFNGGIEMFFLSGMALVTGAVWTVMYNSDILLAVVTTVFSRLRGLPPMLRIAVNYPMKSRVKTGLTLAMFSLVIFTLVFMSALLNSFNGLWEDTDALSGGYDIRGVAGLVNPVTSVEEALGDSKDLKYEDLQAVGSVALAPIQVRQKGVKKKSWTDYALHGIDPGYSKSVKYGLKLRSRQYGSDREVWQALTKNQNLAVVHSSLVPAKVSFNAGEQEMDFTLSGFFREDKKLPEIYLETKNAQTGEKNKLKVIGVVDDMAFFIFGGIITSQEMLDKISGYPVPATTYWFKVKPDVNVAKAEKSVARAFYKNGMETAVMEDEIGEMMRANMMINRLLQGFMGLGLIVGIAALGVIAARSVVERRRQIGMLRAIGFRRGMVQNTFILESSFVAILGIAIGTILALMLSRNVAAFMAKDMPGIVYETPWADVIFIAGLAYVASLFTTFMPARQASKVAPAEALRYE